MSKRTKDNVRASESDDSHTTKKATSETLPDFNNPWYDDNQQLPLKYFTRYSQDESKPYHILESLISNAEHQETKGSAIGHLLLRDFRIRDNPALSLALEHSRSLGVPLVVVYPYSEELLKAHSTSAYQWAYLLNALTLMKDELARFNIPLVVLSAKDAAGSIVEFCSKNNIVDLYTNIEYEVDELRILISLMRSSSLNLRPSHHTCVVKPGSLTTKSKGTQYSVFTPWYKSWISYVESNPSVLKVTEIQLSEQEKTTFTSEIPVISLTTEQQEIFDTHYKIATLNAPVEHFNASFDHVLSYEKNRQILHSFPHMSHHISSGVVSTRMLIEEVLAQQKRSSITKISADCVSYVRQLAWRDFYRHIMCNWPHICMFRPFQLDYVDVTWNHEKDRFSRWCEGKTGYPIIDAAMRQLNAVGYMSNRCRMIVACFLAKNLLVDWRYGEQYFATQLVDFDFASNNGGWGFCASVGVDAQPYFRVFNPWIQSAKFDPKGDFIRKWIPELANVKGKSIHNPYEDETSKDLASKNGYPPPIVDYKESKEIALEKYKEAR